MAKKLFQASGNPHGREGIRSHQTLFVGGRSPFAQLEDKVVLGIASLAR